MSMTCPSFTFIAFCVLSVQMSVLKMDKDLINLLTCNFKGPIWLEFGKKKIQKQAGAGAVPSSGLVKSLVKIEFFLLEIQKKKHDEFLMKLR